MIVAASSEKYFPLKIFTSVSSYFSILTIFYIQVNAPAFNTKLIKLAVSTGLYTLIWIVIVFRHVSIVSAYKSRSINVKSLHYYNLGSRV